MLRNGTRGLSKAYKDLTLKNTNHGWDKKTYPPTGGSVPGGGGAGQRSPHGSRTHAVVGGAVQIGQ